MTFEGLEPARVWHHFATLSSWPRCSGACAPVLDHLQHLVGGWGLQTLRDAAGNMVVLKPASAGLSSAPTVVLQAHVDMVCEQNRGRGHDFAQSGPTLVVDGGWVRADGTTLGADNGIGVSVALALLEDASLRHGPLEALFTFDEETDMGGAQRLDPALLTGRLLLNLDGEGRGRLCIGTAGGQTSTTRLPAQFEPAPASSWTLVVSGLVGGHSGVEIHRQTGNSLVALARVLDHVLALEPGARVVDLVGGDQDNAIPREALAVLAGPPTLGPLLVEVAAQHAPLFAAELGAEGAGVGLEVTPAAPSSRALTRDTTRRLLDVVLAFPHGVLGMSKQVPGLVETSANLARIRVHGDHVEVLSSERSSRASQLQFTGQRVAALARLAGGTTTVSGGFPPWTPDPHSRLARLAPQVWQDLSGTPAVVELIHAGVECSLLGEKIPGLDMISFGAELVDIHTPRERVDIASVAEHYRFTQALLEALAAPTSAGASE